MAQYIDKDALVAWAKETYLCENASMIRKVCYKQLLEHLDTLEVKEVDVNKEISQFIDTNFEKATIGHKLSLRRVAKYFFELGLKAQKGE